MATFTQDIGYSGAGVVADASALASDIVRAGVAKGDRARVRGETNAALLTYAGGQALDAYEGKLRADVAKEAYAALDMLDTGDWVGPKAAGYIHDVADELENIPTIFAGGEAPRSGEVRDFEERLSAISNAAEQRIISQQEARARISAALKKAIAAMPGRADSFRAVARDITGSGDWHIMEAHAALTQATMYERQQAEQAKAAQKMFEDSVRWLSGHINVSPDVAANMILNDPNTTARFSELSMGVAMLGNENARLKEERTLLEGRSEAMRTNIATELANTTAQVQLEMPMIFEGALKDAGVSVEELFNPDGTINYGVAEQTNFKLEAARQQAFQFLRQNRDAQIRAATEAARGRLTGDDTTRLITDLEERYDRMENLLNNDPSALFNLIKAAQNGNRQVISDVGNLMGLRQSTVDLMGGQAMFAAFHANPETFKRNHPDAYRVLRDNFDMATGSVKFGFMSQVVHKQDELITNPTVDIGSSSVDFLASLELGNMATETIRAFARNNEPIPDSLAPAMVQLFRNAALMPQTEEKVRKLLASGELETVLSRMSEEEKSLLATSVQDSFNQQLLGGGFGTAIDGLRSYFEGGFETNGWELRARVKEGQEAYTSISIDPRTGNIGFHVRGANLAAAQGARINHIRHTITNNATLLDKLGIISKEEATREMALRVFNTLSSGQRDRLNVITQPTPTSTATTPTLQVGDIIDGYRYEGGNPNSPDSWKQINE